MHVDESAKQWLRTASVAGGIAALLLLLRAILGITSYFIQRVRAKAVVMDEYEYQAEQPASNSSTFTIIMTVLVFAVTVFLFYLLNRFSAQVKAGVVNNDAGDINRGLNALSRYFKTMGIITIVLASLVIWAVLAYSIGSGRKWG